MHVTRNFLRSIQLHDEENIRGSIDEALRLLNRESIITEQVQVGPPLFRPQQPTSTVQAGSQNPSVQRLPVGAGYERNSVKRYNLQIDEQARKNAPSNNSRQSTQPHHIRTVLRLQLSASGSNRKLLSSKNATSKTKAKATIVTSVKYCNHSTEPVPSW